MELRVKNRRTCWQFTVKRSSTNGAGHATPPEQVSSSPVLVDNNSVFTTGTCFTQKIYIPSSSLLQGKHLPFSPSPLRLNIFRLFVILSLYPFQRLKNKTPFPLPHFASIFFAYLWSFRWSNNIVTLPRYFSFRLPHLNIPTGPSSSELDKNIQRT
jgi:hypothetical protein